MALPTQSRTFGQLWRDRRLSGDKKGFSVSVCLSFVFVVVPSKLNYPCFSSHLACSSTINTTLSFGGTAWPILASDMNLGPVTQGSSDCVGGVFDLSLGSNIPEDSMNPSWVVGDVFLVGSMGATCQVLTDSYPSTEKCLHSIPRYHLL